MLPKLGDNYLDEISFADVRQLRAELLDGDICLKTVKNIIAGTLRACLRDAEAYAKIAISPFVKQPKKFWKRDARGNPNPFTEQERDQIILWFAKHGTPTEVAFVVTMFWTGRRPSELTARRWRDYTALGKLSINSSRVEGEEGETKTTGSERTIDLLPPVVDAVNAIRPLHHAPEAHIFLNRYGRPLNHTNFQQRMFNPGAASAAPHQTARNVLHP